MFSLRLVAVALGAADAWVMRFTMNPDGICYFDMGEAFLRGDRLMAVNSWWGPLYPFLLGLAVKLLRPSTYWEYPLAHFVTFLMYLAALLGFEFFLRSFLADYRRGTAGDDGALPEWAWRALGYSLFIFTSLSLITIRLITPDLGVAAIVYLAAGLVLRIRSGDPGWRVFALLGAVLGAGYWVKAILFPMGLVFIGVGALAALAAGGRSIRTLSSHVLVCVFLFLAIASPWIATLTRAKGRLTWGDTPWVDYSEYVNGVAHHFPSGDGLKHPPRRLLESPPTYEYAQPIGGTYPPGYDASYWHEGLAPYFDLGQQLKTLARSLKTYFILFFHPAWQFHLSLGLTLLFVISRRRSWRPGNALYGWPLLTPALVALTLYAIVFTESRFLGAFLCIFWMGAFSGIRLGASPRAKTAGAALVIAVAVTTLVSTTASTMREWVRPLLATPTPVYWEAARALAESGVGPGDGLAVIGTSANGTGGAFVARLARARIIAEVDDPEQFWNATPSGRGQVVDAFRKAGARAILARGEPPASTTDGRWERLGGTDYYLEVLSSDAHPGVGHP